LWREIQHEVHKRKDLFIDLVLVRR
jgi:hypothetical protein